jgi:hypothetical protein
VQLPTLSAQRLRGAWSSLTAPSESKEHVSLVIYLKISVLLLSDLKKLLQFCEPPCLRLGNGGPASTLGVLRADVCLPINYGIQGLCAAFFLPATWIKIIVHAPFNKVEKFN